MVDQLIVETAEGVREPLVAAQLAEVSPDALTAARERHVVSAATGEDGPATSTPEPPSDRRSGARPGRRATDGFDMLAGPSDSASQPY